MLVEKTLGVMDTSLSDMNVMYGGKLLKALVVMTPGKVLCLRG
jgi:hypothetical protein